MNTQLHHRPFTDSITWSLSAWGFPPLLQYGRVDTAISHQALAKGGRFRGVMGRMKIITIASGVYRPQSGLPQVASKWPGILRPFTADDRSLISSLPG